MEEIRETVDPLAVSPTTQELSRMIVHLQDVNERERENLARVLHDDLGGLLVAAIMDIGWLEQRQHTADIYLRLSRVSAALAAAIDLKRSVIEKIRPTLLDNLGLFAALRWYIEHRCERAHVACTGDVPSIELNMLPEFRIALFRLVQDALTISLAEPELKEVQLKVDVDGEWLRVAAVHRHFGEELIDIHVAHPSELGVIAERTKALNGSLVIERFRAGTALTMRYPLKTIAGG